MKALHSAAAVVMFALACPLAWACAGTQTSSEVRAATAEPGPTVAHEPGHAAPAAKPVISVGTTYPDTQLILPWFLTDIINAVNTRASACELAHSLRKGL